MRLITLTVLLSFAGCASATAGLLPRDALWVVVRSCLVAKETIGSPFPCLEVERPSGGKPGYAVIRAPGSSTHVIVTPTVKIEGMEDPQLQQGDAGTYWRAALVARRFVTESAGDRVPLSSVGLAVNSNRTRSQDQLHIHAECVAPRVLAAVRDQAAEMGRDWRVLNHPVDGDRVFGRRMSEAQMSAGNLFADLGAVPGARGDLSGMTVLVVASRPEPGADLLAIATRTRRRSIERMFDESCTGGAG